MIIDDILFGFKTSTARFWQIPIGRAFHLGLLLKYLDDFTTMENNRQVRVNIDAT